MEQEVDRCNTEEILNVNRTSFRASQLYFSDQIRVSWNQLGKELKYLKSWIEKYNSHIFRNLTFRDKCEPHFIPRKSTIFLRPDSWKLKPAGEKIKTFKIKKRGWLWLWFRIFFFFSNQWILYRYHIFIFIWFLKFIGGKSRLVFKAWKFWLNGWIYYFSAIPVVNKISSFRLDSYFG